MVFAWNECDTKKALVSALVPAGVGAFTAYNVMKDKNVMDFLLSGCECKCAPKDPCVYTAVDILALSPVGYAAYMVFRNGGGFEYNDTKLAMALYGGTLLAWLSAIPVCKKKDRKCLLVNSVITHLLAAGTAYTFYQIDKTAGKLCIPLVVLSGIYTLMSYGGYKKFKTN
uniref:Transmembrane protein n=1 Tax=Parastrongyloides trichosuri TaxID=131310 RepID=A0A0N4ZMI7_PARTI